MERFVQALNEYQQNYLPDGVIELLEGDEINAHPLLKGLPHLTSSNTLHFIQKEDHHLFRRITPSLFLHIAANKANYNLGILKNIAKRISDEIRNKAITTIN